MRRLFTALTLAAALPFATLPLRAEDAPRIAFFNLRQLVESSVKAKRVYTELEVVGKNLQEKLEQKSAEGQKLQSQLQSGTLSDQGREQIQKQLRDLEYEYKKLQEDSQGEFNKVNQKVMGELNRIVFPIIDALAKEQKLQVVINGEQAAQMITWADTEWMKAFTTEVSKRLDAASDTPAAATAPAAATKSAAPAAKPAAKGGKK